MLEELKTIGDRLTAIRKLASLSRRKVGEISEISVHTLRDWERGEAEIGALKLAKYLALYQKFDINITANAILNMKTTPLLPKPESHSFNTLKTSFESLEKGNTLFYIKTDSSIIYFNPLYRDLVLGREHNADDSHTFISRLIARDDINTTIHQSVLNSRIVDIENKLSNTAEKLLIELRGNFDTNNNIIGIFGFLLSTPPINN